MADLDLTITIGGVNYTQTSLASARISSGRQDIYSVGQPAYAQVALFDNDGTGFPIVVNDLLTIKMEDEEEATLNPLFTGRVQDIAITFVPTVNGPRSVWTMTASSTLALLNRRQVLAGGAPAELDGTRARRILQEGLFVRWEEFGSDTWADTDPELAWDTIPPQVQVPIGDGDYEVAALDPNPGGYNAFSLIGELVTSVGGSLIEDGNGDVFYLSAYTRSTLVNETGYATLPTQFFLADSLSGLQQASDLVNIIEVEYGDGVVEARDDESVAKFGRRSSVLRTILKDETVAQARADDLLSNLANPRTKLSSIEWALHAFEGLGFLGTLIPSVPVELAGLPNTLGPISRFMFIEGLEWNLLENQRTLRLYVSDAQLSLASDRWQDIADTIRWDDVSATLQFSDARRVTT